VRDTEDGGLAKGLHETDQVRLREGAQIR